METEHPWRMDGSGRAELRSAEPAPRSWESASGEVGLAATQGRRRGITREECVAAVAEYVKEATASGRHPGVAGYDTVQKARGWPQRQSTIMARFGSWSSALAAAGYEDTKHQRRPRVTALDCLRAVYCYVTEATARRDTPSIAGYRRQASDRGWPAVGTVLARLGSWQNAVAVATMAARSRQAAPPPRPGPAGDGRPIRVPAAEPASPGPPAA